jgi:uncharacterized protein with ParB-like and HNH nuclease domain
VKGARTLAIHRCALYCSHRFKTEIPFSTKARNRCEAAMHAEENRLRPFIEPTKQFIVPLFQRFYVWDKPYWNTLWTDVLELIADEDEQRTHFLGSIVVIPAAKSSPSLPKFVVIDGQQRLATL